VPDVAAVRERVRDIARSEKWRRVAAHRSARADDVIASLGLPATITDGGYNRGDLASCDAAITACDVLIAQTGSVLVTSRSAGGRALSVIAEHHVVIASVEQLVPDLPSAYALLRERHAAGGGWPSMISLITGPSRTGDIERILVLGAHGPKRLTVVMMG
jgi:L-lactate dehydrogenase complex protein LldG